MEIKINRHYTYKIYTPGTSISGNVTITTPCDVLFSNIDIAFVGSATTQNFVQPDPVHATKPFLKLPMPINDASLPSGHIFKAGRVYTIPFHFVVPTQLLMGSCRHRCNNTMVQEHHLRLPPSMGFCPANDQSPDEAKIIYSIVVAGTRNYWDLPIPVRLFRTQKKIRVLPIRPEDAPLDIDPDNTRYLLSKSQCLWKTFFTGREGELTASASQPNAVMLSLDGTTASSSSIRIELTFVPSSLQSAPPRVKSVSGRFISTTFFHILPLSRLPNMETWKRRDDPPFNYDISYKLFDWPIGELIWEKHLGPESRRASYPLDRRTMPKRRASLIRYRNSNHEDSKPSLDDMPMRYTTDVHIPFSIPHSNNDFFLPSFDSCLISRAYALRLSISSGPTHTNIVLKLPLQIGVEDTSPTNSRLGPFGTGAAITALREDNANSLGTANYNVLPEYSSTL